MCNDTAREPENANALDRWCTETYEDRMSFGLRAGKTVFDKQSEFQRVQIMETEFGETLLLDGAFMTAAKVEHYYHEMLAHPALVTAPSIKRVLIIGGGDGGTVREVLRYPEVEQVTLVELDCEVVFACQKHLTSMQVPWDDARLRMVFADGAAYVKHCAAGTFDVILVDGADPVGPAAVLFSAPFYADCKRAMTPDGILASQTESPIAMCKEFLAIQKTMRSVFGRVQPYFGPMPIYPSGTWSWTTACDATPMYMTQDILAMYMMRLNARQAIAESACKYYNANIHDAAFAIPNDLKRALAR